MSGFFLAPSPQNNTPKEQAARRGKWTRTEEALACSASRGLVTEQLQKLLVTESGKQTGIFGSESPPGPGSVLQLKGKVLSFQNWIDLGLEGTSRKGTGTQDQNLLEGMRNKGVCSRDTEVTLGCVGGPPARLPRAEWTDPESPLQAHSRRLWTTGGEAVGAQGPGAWTIDHCCPRSHAALCQPVSSRLTSSLFPAHRPPAGWLLTQRPWRRGRMLGWAPQLP